MEDNIWEQAFEEALRNLNITEDDLKKAAPIGPDATELMEFISTYMHLFDDLPGHVNISRVVKVMAWILACGYPDADVRRLFAGFCQSLVAYGRDLEKKWHDNESNTV